MLRFIERFERFFLERLREEHKESISLSLYPFFAFLLTTASVFIPFIYPFPILSLSLLGQHDGSTIYVINPGSLDQPKREGCGILASLMEGHYSNFSAKLIILLEIISTWPHVKRNF